MKMQANEAPYLRLLIGGIAVILLGASGIAAVMAWTPTSTDVADAALALDKFPPRVRVKCAECGVVVSTREIEQLGEGGAPRGGQNEMPGTSARSYEVTIRMRDGSSRAFVDANPANWRPGERIIFIESASRSND